MVLSLLGWVDEVIVCWMMVLQCIFQPEHQEVNTPNGGPELLPEAEAERRLEAVSSRPLFGAVSPSVIQGAARPTPVSFSSLAPWVRLTDHLVRPSEEHGGERQAQRLGGLEVDDQPAIPGKPPRPVITVSSALAFRKHRCENTPVT